MVKRNETSTEKECWQTVVIVHRIRKWKITYENTLDRMFHLKVGYFDFVFDSVFFNGRHMRRYESEWRRWNQPT